MPQININKNDLIKSFEIIRGINFVSIYNITLKDLKSFFDGIYGYLLLAILLTITYVFFLQTFFIVGIASTRQLFEMLPIYLIIFIPAVTMTSFAKEFEKQTIEYLTTKPLNLIDIVIGKILANTIFTYIGIFFTLPLPILINQTGRLDIGETISGYLGAFLLTLGLTSIGVMVSSFFKNQIAAFLTACMIIFLIYVAGSPVTTNNLNLTIANFISLIGINSYYQSIIRGVIDFSGLLYFGILFLLGITISYINLLSIRVSSVKNVYNKVIFTLGIVFLLSFWLTYSTKYLSWRADLTSSRKYTLSQATKDTVQKPGVTKIEVYASNDAPQQFKYNFEEVKYLLTDYKLAGGNNIQITYVDPKGKESQLAQDGISPIQFNVIGNDQFETKQGYLGIKITNESGDKKEIIPYIDNINQLEYQITRLIAKVKETQKQKLAFASGNGEYSRYDEFSILNQILQDNFEVQDVFIPSVTTQNDKTKVALNLNDYKVLIIANPTEKYTDDSINKIKEFLNNGGKVIFLADNLLIDGTAQITPYEENKKPQVDLFNDLGIQIQQGLVYDLQSRATVTMGSPTTGLPINVPYSLFIIGDLTSQKITSLPQKIFIPWGQSLNITDPSWEVLYKSSERAGILNTQNLDPMQTFLQTDLKQQNLIALREFENGGSLIVLSTGRIFANDYVANSETNLQFALALSEHYGGAIKIAEIKAKDYYATKFTELDTDQKALIRYGAPALSVALLILIFVINQLQKKYVLKKIYSSE